MVKAFDEVVFKQKLLDVHGPIKTKFCVTIHLGKLFYKDLFLGIDRSCQYAKLELLPNHVSFNEFKQLKYHRNS